MGLWFGPRAASLRLAGRTNASVPLLSLSPRSPHSPRIPSIIGACLENLLALFNIRGCL
jgi:hypothetical protein